MKANEFLSTASDTMTQRGKDYDKQSDGTEERSMGKCVEAFNSITGRNLTESEGWMMLVLLKLVRQWSTDDYHHDSALDTVAYAALLAESLASCAEAPECQEVPGENSIERHARLIECRRLRGLE